MQRFRHWLKIIMLSGLSAGLALVLSLTAITFFIYNHPHETWQFVEAHYLPTDLSITWRDMKISVSKSDWRHWRLVWTAEALDIEKTPILSVPLDQVSLTLALGWNSGRLDVALNDMTVKSHRPLKIHSSPPDINSPEQDYYQQLERVLRLGERLERRIRIEQLAIALPDIQFMQDNQVPHIASFNLIKAPAGKMMFNIMAGHLGRIVNQIHFSGNVDLGQLRQPRVFLHAQAVVRGRNLTVAMPLNAAYYASQLRLRANPIVQFKTGEHLLVAAPRVRVLMDSRGLDIDVEGSRANLPKAIAKWLEFKVHMHMPFQKNEVLSREPSTLHASAPISLFFVDANMRHLIERSCACRLPEHLIANFASKIWFRSALEKSAGRHELLDAHLSFVSLRNKLFSIDLAAALKIHRQDRSWEYEPALNSHLQIHNYQGLRRVLDAKNILIPAPFDILQGQIDFKTEGPIALNFKEGALETLSTRSTLAVNLASKSQTVNVVTSSLVRVSADLRRTDVAVKAKIAQLQLDLPPFDPLVAVPKVFRDSRIVLAPQSPPKSDKSFKLVLSFTLETVAPDSIKLISPLASPYIPLALNIQQQNLSSPTGKVQVGAFQINYLRRTVFVDSLNLDLHRTSNNDYPIKGDFHVKQTDYTVLIHVGGTLGSPQVQLSSTPYLERADIISVLLYDRTSDQLVSADAETVGNVQAAMADRAIGLLGLWAFAGTPIRSFSYNPITKVYSATVLIANGVTAGIGTSWDQNPSLEVRKRLSQQWVLTASVNSNEDSGEVGKVVLQWERRF